MFYKLKAYVSKVNFAGFQIEREELRKQLGVIQEDSAAHHAVEKSQCRVISPAAKKDFVKERLLLCDDGGAVVVCDDCDGTGHGVVRGAVQKVTEKNVCSAAERPKQSLMKTPEKKKNKHAVEKDPSSSGAHLQLQNLVEVLIRFEA